VRVRFVNVGLEAEARIGESLLEVARRAGAPEASRCKGVCACSTCHVYVEAGAELLSPPSEAELDLLSLSAREPRDASRLGCQARFVAEGPCDVAISEESFQAYLDLYPQDRERALALWLKNGG
jgi:ferredoxin, 2Fe-2S